jgi:hypothetical protein
MNGSQINNLVKSIHTLTDEVRLSHDIAVIDNYHVQLMTVRTLDGSPCFGAVQDDVALDTRDVIKMKVGDRETLIPEIIDGRYVLRNNSDFYSFKLVGWDKADPKIPSIERLDFEGVPTKTLEKALSQAKSSGCDYVELMADGQCLKVQGYDVEGKPIIGKVLVHHQTYEHAKSLFDIDFLLRIVKIAPPEITVSLPKDDYPCIFVWEDGYYHYEVMTAHRVQTEGPCGA